MKLPRLKKQHCYSTPTSLIKQVPMDKPFGIISFMDLIISKPLWLPRKVRAVMIKEN